MEGTSYDKASVANATSLLTLRGSKRAYTVRLLRMNTHTFGIQRRIREKSEKRVKRWKIARK